MEPLKKDEALLEQARKESLDRRYAQVRRAQSVVVVLNLALIGFMGVSAFFRSSWLYGVLAITLCIVIVAGHMHSSKLTKEAFLARNTGLNLPHTLVMILAVFGAIVVIDWLRAGGA